MEVDLSLFIECKAFCIAKKISILKAKKKAQVAEVAHKLASCVVKCVSLSDSESSK